MRAKVNNQEFGVYVGESALSFSIPLVDSNDKVGFWELQRACTREVHTQLHSRKHRNFEVVPVYVLIVQRTGKYQSTFEYNEGRRTQILNITNCGALKTEKSEDSPFKCAGSYFSLQGEKMGHTFGNSILTVDGKLYWAVENIPHITTKAQAEEFTKLS